MKQYHNLTTQEKLALSEGEFLNAVKLECVSRGIKPPITLENAIKQVGWRGIHIPQDTVTFYEVCIPESYGDPKRTGLCFRTPEEARKAVIGGFSCIEDGYGATKKKTIRSGEPTVREVYIGLDSSKSIQFKLEELAQDTAEFDKVIEECKSDLEAIRQAAYNAEVLKNKRASYLGLAQGNEEIARAFWAKCEIGEFPTEPES